MKIFYFLAYLTVLLGATTHPALKPRAGSHVVIWGEMNASYGGKTGRLFITDVRSQSKSCEEIKTSYQYPSRPSFINAFDQQVKAKYPDILNYLSGYSSYYECFEDGDDAAAKRQALINNAVKVEYFSW